MTKLNKVFTFLIFVFIAAVIAVGVVFAWTNPSGNPPAGGGALYYSGGKVGIGTASPQKALEVNGEIRTSDRIEVRHTGSALEPAVSVGSGWNSGLYITDNDNGNLGIAVDGSLRMQILAGGGLALTVDLPGNVGIGTTGPGYKLDVQGGQINASGGLCIAGDCKTVWPASGGSQWTTSGNNIYNANTGNVGIGTASPGYKLDVQGNFKLTGQMKLGASTYILPDAAGNWIGGDLQGVGNEGIFVKGGQILLVSFDGDGNLASLGVDGSNRNINFTTDNTERMRITSSGNVGIGTTNPGTSKLKVAGTVESSSGGFKFPDGTTQTSAAASFQSSAARAYRSGNQAISSSVWTKTQLNAESYDVGNNFDSATNFRYTAPSAGKYLVSVVLNGQLAAGGYYFQVAIYKNGVLFSQSKNYPAEPAPLTFNVVDILDLAQNDYVEMYVYSTTGLTVFGGEGLTFMTVQRIS